MMPSLALIFWPIIAPLFFGALGRQRGLIWSVIVGYLFLPEAWAFDLPLLPPYAKREAIAFGVLLGVLVTQQKAEFPPEADSVAKGVMTSLIVMLLMLTPFLNMLTNRDSYTIGPLWFPPIGLWDVFANVFSWLIALTPFFFARRFLYNYEYHRELLKAMMIMGLIYAPLVLFELRMSPQLNNIVYGYFPHDWVQHVRGGGWRPLVFLSHGLDLGFFLLTVVLAVIGLLRISRGSYKFLYILIGLGLFILLLASRNFGAFAIGAMLALGALLLKPKTHVRIAVILAILFTTYPITRQAFIQPLMAGAAWVSEDRAGSLGVRFDNEDILMAHAMERPVAGWGPWGRWRVYGPNGEDFVTSDGIWVIQLSMWGWIGFLGFFGLLMAPILLLKRAEQRQPYSTVTSVMALMIAGNLVYMIPNATLTPITWLIAGALAGYVQTAKYQSVSDRGETDAVAGKRKSVRYTRFTQKQGAATTRASRFN